MPQDATTSGNMPQFGVRAGVPAGGRMAVFDTGAGLRFAVALDRGGDIVDAGCDRFALARLSPDGSLPPNPAHHTGGERSHGWAGGMVATRGPEHAGGPREDFPARPLLPPAFRRRSSAES